MKVYVYLRVSTEQQTESGAGLEAQQNACLAFTQQRDWNIARIFKDESLSGSLSLEKRPGMFDAIAALKKGDILLVAKRDRLGRDPFVMAMIEAAVEKKGGKIISTAGEGTENNDPSSILMRRMVDAFSEYERLIIGVRTKAALQAKKKNKERIGHIPFGYSLSEDGIHLEEQGEEQDILKQMLELKEQGLSLRKIAIELNDRKAFNRGQSKWNHVSLHRIIQRAA